MKHVYSEKCKKCIVDGCPDSCHVKQEYYRDWVHVVRCRDCIHWFFCRDPLNKEPDDYCSDGERV